MDNNKFFLLVREGKGWKLPGGGLEYGETPQQCIRREIVKEMGINIKFVEDTPSYFVTTQKPNGIRFAHVI